MSLRQEGTVEQNQSVDRGVTSDNPPHTHIHKQTAAVNQLCMQPTPWIGADMPRQSRTTRFDSTASICMVWTHLQTRLHDIDRLSWYGHTYRHAYIAAHSWRQQRPPYNARTGNRQVHPHCWAPLTTRARDEFVMDAVHRLLTLDVQWVSVCIRVPSISGKTIRCHLMSASHRVQI